MFILIKFTVYLCISFLQDVQENKMASQDYKYYICHSNIFCVCSISLLIPVSHHTIIYLFFHPDPNNPPCMRFYTYMAGRGVGRLRVMLEDVVTRKQKIMWALQGHQGTRWVQGQLPLSSGVPFKASQYFLSWRP